MVVKPTHSLILNQRHCYMIIFRKKRKLKKKNDSRTNERKQDIKWFSYILNCEVKGTIDKD